MLPTRAQTTGTILSHKHIILKPDAAELVITLKFRIIHKSLVGTFPLPLLYQGRDEIDARFICHNMTRFQEPCHAKVANAQKR